MRLLCGILVIGIVTALGAVQKPFAAESEPMGMGVSNGDLLKDWPFLEVVASEAKCVAGKTGGGENGATGAKSIADAKSGQLASLFDDARRLAAANGVLFYGISNLRQDVSRRENGVHVESCGELLALKKSAKK